MIFLNFFKIFLILIIIVLQTNIANAKELLTLKKSINLALKKNINLQKSNYDTLLNEEKINQVSAQYEPSLSSQLSKRQASLFGQNITREIFNVQLSKKLKTTGANLTIDWQNKKDDEFVLFNPLAPQFDANLGLTYSQPLLNNFLGKNDLKSLKIANISNEIIQIQLAFQKSSIINNIEKAYLEYDFAKRNLNTQKTSLARSEKLLKINKQKYRDGLIEEVDIKSTEAAIILRQTSILIAEDTLNNAFENLLSLLGLELETDFTFETINFSNFKSSHTFSNAHEIFEKAISNRNDLKIISLTKEINTIKNKIKKNEKLPNLTAVFQASELAYGTSWQNTYESFVPVFYVGLNINLFPFNKRSKSLLKETEYMQKQTDLNYQDMKINIQKQCKAIFRSLTTNTKYMKAAKTVLNIQTKKLKLEEIKYNQGRSSLQWLLNFEDDLTNAEIEYYKSLKEYYKTLSNLKFVSGEKYESN
ncbi:TolC family protein [bacterium]